MGLDQPNQNVLAEVLGQNKAISSQSQFVKWRNSNDMARRGGCEFVSGRMSLFFFVFSFLFFFSFSSVFLIIVVLFCGFR